MQDSSFHNIADEIDSAEDEPKKERRPVILVGIVVVLLLLAGAGTTYAVVSQLDQPEEDLPALAGDDPPEDHSPTEQPADEGTVQAAEEPTSQPDEAPTENPTEALAEEPPNPPTDAPPPTAVPTRTPLPATTLVPTETPTPTVEPTEPPVTSICDPFGGFQWEGLVCPCSGQELYVTVCMTTKIEAPTGNTCTPDPAECPTPEPEITKGPVCTCYCPPIFDKYRPCHDTCTGQLCGADTP